MLKPRGSRAESAEPFSPPTVDQRTATFVLLPTWLKRSAEVYAASEPSLDGCQEVMPYQFTDIMSDDKFSKCTSSFGVHNTLGDAFSVEVGKKVDEMEILQQDRAVLANCLRGSSEGDRSAVRGSVNWSCYRCHCCVA